MGWATFIRVTNIILVVMLCLHVLSLIQPATGIVRLILLGPLELIMIILHSMYISGKYNNKTWYKVFTIFNLIHIILAVLILIVIILFAESLARDAAKQGPPFNAVTAEKMRVIAVGGLIPIVLFLAYFSHVIRYIDDAHRVYYP